MKVITVMCWSDVAFSALTLLIGHQEGASMVISGARCRLFAHGLADATASQNHTISCLI